MVAAVTARVAMASRACAVIAVIWLFPLPVDVFSCSPIFFLWIGYSMFGKFFHNGKIFRISRD
jgi:predicted tellurium resistance membrane protein TerC